jgi:putative colanic acid biosynthesis acetyltransferase WcaF
MRALSKCEEDLNMPEILNAKANETLYGGPSFTIENRIYRFFWRFTWFMFARWTPKPLKHWRIFLLRLFGAKIGKYCDVRGSVDVWSPKNLIMKTRSVLAQNVICYNMAIIDIGEGVIVSQGAYLCTGTHDVDDQHFQLEAFPIVLADGSWICTDAFVGPGAVVNAGAVIGARAVAFGQFKANGIYVGNPAKCIRMRNCRS